MISPKTEKENIQFQFTVVPGKPLGLLCSKSSFSGQGVLCSESDGGKESLTSDSHMVKGGSGPCDWAHKVARMGNSCSVAFSFVTL